MMFGFRPNFIKESYYFTSKNGLAELVCNYGRIECLLFNVIRIRIFSLIFKSNSNILVQKKMRFKNHISLLMMIFKAQ